MSKKLSLILSSWIIISCQLPLFAQPSREFFLAATTAGQNDRWKQINWQPNMLAAKNEGQKQHKPILVVLHNNFGGDSQSHEC
jgi:hypothetical protein